MRNLKKLKILFFCFSWFKFEGGGKGGNEGGADENTADNISEPMDAGEEAAESDDKGKKGDGKIDESGEFGFNVVAGEENGEASESEGEENVGRGVGSLQSAADENGAVVDDKDFFEEEVDGGDSDVKHSEDF